MRRILLIDDHDANQDLISRYLNFFGYAVEIAGDGKSGLATARHTADELDVVLLDMNLPDIDGWEVARVMKADALVSHLPIIAVTAHAMLGDREAILACGCDDYISKPIDFQLLLDKIELHSKRVPQT